MAPGRVLVTACQCGYCRQMKTLWRTLLMTVAVGFAFAATAEAASVAYIDKGGVWVSSLNGKQKRKVSGKTKDGRRWTGLDQLRLSALARPHRRRAQRRVRLLGHAVPVPVSQFQQGTYVASAVQHFPRPFRISGQMWPTLVGKRLVAASSDTGFGLQQASFGTPYTYDFSPWITVSLNGFEIGRTDVAANGKLAATGIDKGDSHKALMIRIPHPGGGPTSDCLLPSRGAARNVSISQDGNSIAWEDRRGVVISGAPTFGGTATCRLKRRPVVISGTATYPSIGAAKVR